MPLSNKRLTTEELEKEIAELEAAEANSVKEEDDDLDTSEEENLVETKSESSKREETSEEDTEKKSKGQDEDTFKKRYGDLRRHSQAQIKELKEEIEALKAKTETKVRPLASDESVSEWKKKYPDIASIVETVADRIAQEKFDRANLDLDEIKEFKKEATKEQTLREIRERHSDFDDIVSSEAFEEWIDEQPDWANDAIYSSNYNSKSAVRVIDLYKADMGLVERTQAKSKKEAATSVKTKSSTPSVKESEPRFKFTESQIDGMSLEEYEKNESAILEAQKKGEILMDRTGAAR